jgi:hypothetical protein
MHPLTDSERADIARITQNGALGAAAETIARHFLCVDLQRSDARCNDFARLTRDELLPLEAAESGVNNEAVAKAFDVAAAAIRALAETVGAGSVLDRAVSRCLLYLWMYLWVCIAPPTAPPSRRARSTAINCYPDERSREGRLVHWRRRTRGIRCSPGRLELRVHPTTERALTRLVEPWTVACITSR